MQHKIIIPLHKYIHMLSVVLGQIYEKIVTESVHKITMEKSGKEVKKCRGNEVKRCKGRDFEDYVFNLTMTIENVSKRGKCTLYL